MAAAAAVDTVFAIKEIMSDTNIVNTSRRRIIVLYNSVEGFLQKTDTARFLFQTECMICEPVIPYRDHLLFAGQLELSFDKAVFNKAGATSPDTAKPVKRVGSYDNLSTVRFSFSQGAGKIRHLGLSCMDAYLKEVTLDYDQGHIMIRNVLNAEFFEYDMDRDGQLEQYVLAMRNCSKELAVLRIQ